MSDVTMLPWPLVPSSKSFFFFCIKLETSVNDHTWYLQKHSMKLDSNS